MDHLEPWNMFTNDFVAEETDELLTDSLVAEYGTQDRAKVTDVKEDEDEDTGFVKQEPTDIDDDNNGDGDDADQYNNSRHEQQRNDFTSTRLDEESNDNELFDFSIEPRVKIAVPPLEDEITTSGSDHNHVHQHQPQQHQQQQQEQQQQQIDYDVAVIFVCPACGLEMESHEKWKKHIDFVHMFNTRRGLNFIPIDKLYHQCLECKRKIAMHSMENLMKHKFTHLPYKRAKCKICLKEYKYRQDLMVHLRMTHKDDLLAIAKAVRVSNAKQLQQQRQHQQLQQQKRQSVNFAIKNVQENAIDIFENTNDGIEVKSEAIFDDDDDDEQQQQGPTSSKVAPSNFANLFEESLSRSSSHLSETSARQQRPSNVIKNEELCEKYIQYICPQCGTEFGTQPQWRQHIEYVHNFGTRTGLNFKEVNMKMHAQCLECDKVIHVNLIQNLQVHKFSHLTHKSWIRCKLCFNTFVGHKEIAKHLLTQHHLGDAGVDNDANDGNSQDDRPDYDPDDADDGSQDDQLLSESRGEDRTPDSFESYVDYLCPACGQEFQDKKRWRKHIVQAHHLTDMKVLNFKAINERQVMCLDCSKVITNAYGVQNAQQHKFTHLPYKSFVRCRLCAKSYTDRKGLVKHLRSRHRIGDGNLTQKNASSSFSQSSPYSERPPQSQFPLQKEIVKHANFTFEIKFLDEDDADDSQFNDTDMLDDDTPVPELSFGNSFGKKTSGVKCRQCNAVFDSQRLLMLHINDEHEFLDFNNLRPLPENPRFSYNNQTPPMQQRSAATSQQMRERDRQRRASQDDFVNDDSNNDLLMPTGDEEEISSSSQEIEKNFCYLCPNCGFECATQMLWRRHINDVHNYDKRSALNFRPIDKFRYQCLQCNDIVSSTKLKGLQDHKFRHLSYRLYIKCMLCGTCYNHKPNMMNHLRQRHNIIDTRFSYDGYEQSMADTSQSKAMNRSLPSSANPIAKLPQQPVQPKPPAGEFDSLSYHNAVDHESITYFCPQCNEGFATHVFWRKHIVEQHNLNSRQGLNFRQIDEHHYLCLQCYKRVTVTHTKGAIGQLQSHKFRHLPFKSFKCTACNGEFVRKQMFFKHLNRETNKCDALPIVEAEDDIGVDDDRNKLPKEEQQEQQEEGEQQQLQQLPHEENYENNERNNFEECYILICPQCGLQFETQRTWREHINSAHDFVKRETLNIKRINSNLHECLQCGETVNGNKLRDLQIHKFKHLPFGAYIQCRYCNASYFHMRNIQDHLKLKHRNMLAQKNNEVFEEISFPDDNDTNNCAAEPDEQYLLG